MIEKLKAPFPYFGGKRKVADFIWSKLGTKLSFYIEPFFGSGAVLLRRPKPFSGVEIINDKDGFVCNAWRAIKNDPDGLVKYCNCPCSHIDFMARKKYIFDQSDELTKKLIDDESYYDVKIAGYWIYILSNSIGSDYNSQGQSMPRLTDNAGITKFISHEDKEMKEMLRSLSERFINVKTICGDWKRLFGGKWRTHKSLPCGVFFDPPYSDLSKRSENIYKEESLSVAHDVRNWCVENGSNPKYRIVLAGYSGEHEDLLNHGWTFQNWKANGGYSNQNKKEKNENRFKEVLWISPHCLKDDQDNHGFLNNISP